ncbi:MAG: hypothetical protein LC797_06425 [Chloroflexi bacterium]|nr:hypothetical protein [Chloroflexota bacterium]
MPSTFKAIQLDPASHQRTGVEHVLGAETRQTAIYALLALLQAAPAEARIDPTRTLVQVHAQLWTIVGSSSSPPSTEPSAALRRAGAKHRRVR